MRRAVLLFCTLLLASATPACSQYVGTRGGPGYVLSHDWGGEWGLQPRNDAEFWNGEPMDLRTRSK